MNTLFHNRRPSLTTLVGSARMCLLTLAISACVAVPKDSTTLPALDIAHANLATDIKLAHDGWPEAQWWISYRDPQLDALIKQALSNSPTLEAAAARIAAAEAAVTVSAAAQELGVDFNAAANNQRYSANGLFPPPIGGSYVSQENLRVQAHYDFDWWGKNKARIAAAAGETKVRRAQYAQAELVLATAIAQSYFNLQSDWARLANMEKMAASARDLLADKVKRISHGLASADEQTRAEVQLAELNRQIAQLNAQTLQEREALRALIASGTDNVGDLKPAPLADVPHAMPVQLGMELLARRPDLQAQRWRVEASLSRIEVAQAAFYPDFNLAGSVGLDSISVSNLLEAGSRTTFAGATLAVPLFNGTALKGRITAARSERNELVADYNQTVIASVREVAQAGANLRGIENQLAKQTEVEQSTQALLGSAQKKFNRGLTDHATTLAAELAVLQKNDMHLQLQNQQLLAEVLLVKALGGGYRADTNNTQAAVVPTKN